MAEKPKALGIQLNTSAAQWLGKDDKMKVIKRVAAKSLDVDRFLAMALIEANKPELAGCEVTSALRAAMNCAVIGLLPGAMLGQAYFLKFNKKYKEGKVWKKRQEVQLIIGYKGYLELAFKSGFITHAHPEVVLDGEEFRLHNTCNGTAVEHDLTPRFTMNVDESQIPSRGNIIGAYCIYHTRGGVQGVVGVSRAEIANVDTNENVWKSDFPAMCRKTAILRARKEWRVSVAFDQAADQDRYEYLEREQQPLLSHDVEPAELEATPELSLDDLPVVVGESTTSETQSDGE